MSSWIAHGQPSPGDSVLISRYQQRQCIKWYGEIQVLRNSVIPGRDSIINIQQVFIQDTEIKLQDIDNQLTASKAEVVKQKKRKKRALIWGAAATGAAILEGIIIWIGVK